MNASLLRRLLPKPSGLTKKLALWSVAVLSVAAGHQALAAGSATWKGNAGSLNWNDVANWGTGAGPVPGASSGTTNQDVATFNTNPSTTAATLDLGSSWNVKNIVVSLGSGGNNTQPITFGAGGANVQTLSLTSGGSFSVNFGNTANLVVDATVLLAGTYTISHKSLGTETFAINGDIKLGGNTTSTLTFAGQTTNNNVVGVIGNGSLGGTLSIFKQEGGKWIFSGTNTYTGATTVNFGTLQAGSTQAFGVNSAVNLTPLSSTQNGTLALNSFSNTIGSLASTANGSNAGLVTLGTATLTIAGVNASPVDFAGAISGTGGSVTKSGSGTQTFSGANTYTGTTTVSTGTLLVNGTHTGGGNYSVSGILGGSGTITPAAASTFTVNSGGSIAPGASAGAIGTLTFNGATRTGAVATFSNGATFSFDLNATSVTGDQIALLNGASGDLVFDSNVINFTVAGSLSNGQSYTLFTAAAASNYGGNFSVDGSNHVNGGLSFAGLGGSFQTQSYILLNGSNLELHVVPEPATWALLAAGLTVVVTFRRRRSA